MRNQEYYIAILGEYYQPDIQGHRRVSWIETKSGDPAAFETIEEARSAIAAEESGVYILRHNEAGHPEYCIVSEDDFQYISSGRFGDGSNYDWDGAACVCGECDTCHQMMIEQNRKYVQANSL